MANSFTEPIAHPATAQEARAAPRAAPSPTIHFLALVSDQGLRTIVIAGRPELGAPDWRGNVPGKADDGPGDHGRRCLARVTPRAEPRAALFRFELRAALGVRDMSTKPVIVPVD